MTEQPVDHNARMAAADAELAGELFTADAEFPPGDAVSKRRRRGPTVTLPDIDHYQPQEAA